jgi:hypothetical protein
MLKVLDTYDWAEVFCAAGEHDELIRREIIAKEDWDSRAGRDWDCPAWGSHNPRKVSSAAPEHMAVDVPSFTREDVVEILAIQEGANDGPDWHLVCRLKDGRFAYLTGACDYTGWD